MSDAQLTEGTVHVVASGERLSDVAASYGVSVQAVLEANPNRPRHKLPTSGTEVFRAEFFKAGDRITIPAPQGKVSKAAFLEAHPSTLAIYCSDGRFTESVEDLVRHELDVLSRFDVLAIPGGPALLDVNTASLVELETMRPATSFLIRGHGIKKVSLIAHAGCGFYKKRYAGMPAPRVFQRQLADLRRAAEWIAANHAGVVVQPFYATPENGHVRFSRVEVVA